jgi:hypothetical protein
MFLKHLIWTSQLEKKVRILENKIFLHGYLFTCAKNFMDKLPLNLVLHSPFVQLQHYNKVLAKWKCTPIINWFVHICSNFMIQWYIGCKPPLIEIFIYNFFSKHPPWYIKIPQVSKSVKLW